MPTKHCAFANCTSDSRRPENGVSFVPFAKPGVDRDKCLRWIHATRRKDLSIEKINIHRYICTKHFIGGTGPTPENPDPVAATASKIPKARSSRKRRNNDDMNEDEPGPAIDVSFEKIPSEESSRAAKRNKKSSEAIENNEESNRVTMSDEEASEATISDEELFLGCIEENIWMKSTEELTHSVEHEIDTEVETNYKVIIEKLRKQIISLEEANRIEKEKRKSEAENGYMRIESCNEPKQFKFYTGLTHEQFDLLWQFLGPTTECKVQAWLSKSKTDSNGMRLRKYTLSLKNQLFLTLVRLRCGLLVEDLSYRFGLSISQISKTVTTWVQLMYIQFKHLDIFPTAEVTRRKGLPKAFRKFKNIRTIIDGFEISIQRSNDYRQQGNTYSTYKSRNTVKFLVGIVPTGGCCFLSDGFEGCISDKEIVKKSGFLELLHKQDVVLADRGFNIADLCNKIGCSVIIPPFLKGRDRLTNQEVRQTRDIAAARIHVERFIGRMKEFRLLQKTIPKTMLPLLSQIVFVIAMLVNFQPPLVE